MHYRLNEQFSLCGYRRLPFALYDAQKRETRFFAKVPFMLLARCDGRSDIDADALDANEKEALDAFIREGVITECAPGEHIDGSQEYRFFDAKYRKDAQLSITGLCNYQCKHCFQGAPHGKLGNPSFDELMHIADQMSQCGIRRVCFTGGEPLVRGDFWEVFDGFTERDVGVVNIFTNGSLCDERFLDELDRRVQHGILRPSIDVSFDGVGEHDWLRGVEGAERVAIDAIRRFSERSYSVSCSMCLHKRNIHTLRDTVNLLAECGASFLRVSVTKPEGLWANEKDHILSTEEGWSAFLDYLPYYYVDGVPIELAIEGCFLNKRHSLLWMSNYDNPYTDGWEQRITCPTLRSHFYIGPQGMVLPCMNMGGTHLEELFSNIHETELSEMLQPDSTFVKLSEITAGEVCASNARCRDCEHRMKCLGGCRACGAVEGTGSYLDFDPYACNWHTNGWSRRFEEAVQRGVSMMDPLLRARFMEKDAGRLERKREKLALPLAKSSMHDGGAAFRQPAGTSQRGCGIDNASGSDMTR